MEILKNVMSLLRGTNGWSANKPSARICRSYRHHSLAGISEHAQSEHTCSGSAEICIAPPAGPVVCMEEQPVQSVMDTRERVAATARHRCTKADWESLVAAVPEGRCADCESVTWVPDERNTCTRARGRSSGRPFSSAFPGTRST